MFPVVSAEVCACFGEAGRRSSMLLLFPPESLLCFCLSVVSPSGSPISKERAGSALTPSSQALCHWTVTGRSHTAGLVLSVPVSFQGLQICARVHQAQPGDLHRPSEEGEGGVRMAAGGQDLLHPPGERAGGRVPPGVGARPGHPCLRSPTPKACGAPAACQGPMPPPAPGPGAPLPTAS